MLIEYMILKISELLYLAILCDLVGIVKWPF